MYTPPSWRSSTTVIRINDGDTPLAIPTKPTLSSYYDAEIQSRTKRFTGTYDRSTCSQRRHANRKSGRGLKKEDDDIPLAMLAYQKGMIIHKTYSRSNRHSAPSTPPLTLSSSGTSSKPITSAPRKQNRVDGHQHDRRQRLPHHRYSSPATLQHRPHHPHPKRARTMRSDGHRSSMYPEPTRRKTHPSRRHGQPNAKLPFTPENFASTTTSSKTTLAPKTPTCFSCFKFKRWSSCLIKKMMFQKKRKVNLCKTASIRSKLKKK
ncbi:hypothetical protein [Absidia glauca]|uniref:Uncharacterized protein n=1 Tax=Absidia glauca TaxID=4829 RepID=A0A163KGS1_ABSGL|nr:hypothetical protein [Absidia glauca]